MKNSVITVVSDFAGKHLRAEDILKKEDFVNESEVAITS